MPIYRKGAVVGFRLLKVPKKAGPHRTQRIRPLTEAQICVTRVLAVTTHLPRLNDRKHTNFNSGDDIARYQYHKNNEGRVS